VFQLLRVQDVDVHELRNTRPFRDSQEIPVAPVVDVLVCQAVLLPSNADRRKNSVDAITESVERGRIRDLADANLVREFLNGDELGFATAQRSDPISSVFEDLHDVSTEIPCGTRYEKLLHVWKTL
jgi:hypothetical protein